MTSQIALDGKTQMAELCGAGIDLDQVSRTAFLLENKVEAVKAAEHQLSRWPSSTLFNLPVLDQSNHEGCSGCSLRG
jgi:hypothetical protein